MKKINVQKNGIYKIQVNDSGDCIEFDVDDVGTQIKCYESIEKIEKLENETKEKMQKLIDSKDNEINKKMAYIENDMFKKMREIMDEFLGKDACQKIFGNRNYYSMYNDLFEELSKKRKELNGKSHFDMMGINAKTINEKIINKYYKGKENVI